jgi:hypothetical protein
VEDKHSTWLQFTGRLELLVKFFSFGRCIYTYTCDVCKRSLRITLQLNALLHTPWVYALSLCHHHIHWYSPIHTTLTLQTFPLRIFTVNTIFCTCFWFQGHFTCLGKLFTWLICSLYLHYFHRGSRMIDSQLTAISHGMDYVCKSQDWWKSFGSHWMDKSSSYSLGFYGNMWKKYFILHRIFCCVCKQGSYTLIGNVLHKQLQCYTRKVALQTHIWKCGHRQDIEQFPHRNHNQVRVNFVMGHRCPLQHSSR